MQQETIKASEFKAKCLSLMDSVSKNGNSYVVTKNGKPVAQFCPVSKRAMSLADLPHGNIEVIGDIDGPLYTQEELDGFLEREVQNILGTRRRKK